MKTTENATLAASRKWFRVWVAVFMALCAIWGVSFAGSLFLTDGWEDAVVWIMTGSMFGLLLSYWKLRGHEITMKMMDSEESR